MIYKSAFERLKGVKLAFVVTKAKIFTCKYYFIRCVKISDKTLAKILDKDIMYNGFQFKSIGSNYLYNTIIHYILLFIKKK